MVKVCLKIYICPIIRYGGSSLAKTTHNGSIIASIMHYMHAKI
jgi:hypothetical protein